MQKKSNMTWQVAVSLSALITLMYVLPLCFPLYLQLMGGEAFIFISSVPEYISLLYNAVFIFSFTFLLFIFYFHILRRSFTSTKQILYLTAGTILITLLLGILQVWVHTYLFSPKGSFSFSSLITLGVLLNNISIVVIVIFISHILNLSRKRQQIALQYEALKVENMQTRYQALKNQVDPHFLFNTMSILDSLVDDDKQKAHEYIQRFSSVYRYILQQRETVTLDEELRFINDYFGLLQVRYGENLTLMTQIDSAFRNYTVVPLGLQTLVENSVKHNIISRQKPLCITIATTADRSLTVSNNYQPKPMTTAGAGIGLANLSERCLLKWHKDITIEQTNDVFSVTLPLMPESPKTT